MSTIHGASHKAIWLFREPPAALPVYWIYCARCNDERVAWASIRGLIKDTGWSQNPVIEGRAWLVEHEALELVKDYVRPKWRKLPDDQKKKLIARDRTEYYRVTGYIVVDGVRYELLYAPAQDAEPDEADDAPTPAENAVSPGDTAANELEGAVSSGDVSPGDTLPAVSPHDMSPGDTELDSLKELDSFSLSSELDSTTTSGVVVEEPDQNAWSMAFLQLEIQDPGNFESFLRGARLLAVERVDTLAPGDVPVFRVGVRHDYAREMCQYRLYRSIRRVLSDVRGGACELRFEVSLTQPQADDAAELPLFRQLAQMGGVAPLAMKTVRELFEAHMGPITPATESAVAQIERQYDAATVAEALKLLGDAKVTTAIDKPLNYLFGILHNMTA